MAANSTESEVNDLFGYLSLDSKEDVKTLVLKYLLGLTGSADGMKFIEKNPKLLEKVIELTDDNNEGVQKDAFVFLLNASASEIVARRLETMSIFELILPRIIEKNCAFADNAAMLLSNLTRSELSCELCLKCMEKTPQYSLKIIFDILQNEKYNDCVDLHHLAAFLSNLSRIKAVRMVVLERTSNLIQTLLPYISFQNSVVRRKGVVGIIRNCCFEYESHNWLLGDDVDILPILLLPLAGPEEFSESDNDKLPLDLQYLDDDKKRESDPGIRKMLLECLLMLCSTKSGRRYIKEKNAYVIIRELHKWENDEAVCQTIENLVQVLIGDEPEDDMANLHEVEIPDDIRAQLEEVDKK
ncbi:protein HGH1 homolog [Dendronephthya gigantea]|uniref:protein HGH1 homolog n=1 Tax=Dendronephthya gigantea TaxID=151771 RepID=UPI001069B988|nr:protein HGH1 homolog [Dendronephthya gigantea]